MPHARLNLTFKLAHKQNKFKSCQVSSYKSNKKHSTHNQSIVFPYVATSGDTSCCYHSTAIISNLSDTKKRACKNYNSLSVVGVGCKCFAPSTLVQTPLPCIQTVLRNPSLKRFCCTHKTGNERNRHRHTSVHRSRLLWLVSAVSVHSTFTSTSWAPRARKTFPSGSPVCFTSAAKNILYSPLALLMRFSIHLGS